MSVRSNTLLMLERRGYDVTIIESDASYIRIKNALIVFIPDEKVSINHMKNILSLCLEDEKVFIIHGKTITSESKNIILAKKTVETFTYDEMGFDILDVIPLHSKVEEPKHKDWKRFPILLSSDMACRYFGFNKGDVVRVVEDTIMFRQVV